MTARIHIDSPQRTADVEGETALVVAGDQVVSACSSEDEAFDLWLTVTEWLATHANPSRRWQALLTALAHGRAARTADRRSHSLPDYTSASTVLEVIKETEGPDAYARVRKAVADRMLGRG